ncbi:hypothetical protein [Streptomyces sp. YKOK-I1]
MRQEPEIAVRGSAVHSTAPPVAQGVAVPSASVSPWSAWPENTVPRIAAPRAPPNRWAVERIPEAPSARSAAYGGQDDVGRGHHQEAEAGAGGERPGAPVDGGGAVDGGPHPAEAAGPEQCSGGQDGPCVAYGEGVGGRGGEKAVGGEGGGEQTGPHRGVALAGKPSGRPRPV